MKASQECISLIMNFEHYRSEPYLCPAGKWTIGYGHTAGVTPIMAPVTMQKAIELLYEDLEPCEKAIYANIKTPLVQSQFDALCSFIFNVGVGNFRKSTLLKLINNGEMEEASCEFGKWVHCNGKVLNGLVIRRESERILFTRDMSQKGDNHA